jgi:hypothetical protein
MERAIALSSITLHSSQLGWVAEKRSELFQPVTACKLRDAKNQILVFAAISQKPEVLNAY